MASVDLLHRQILVRLLSLPDVPQTSDALLSLLTSEGRARADRFRFPEDRARFVLGRALLARCLQRYAGHSCTPPQLGYSEQNRPFLAAHPNIQFSISHTRDLVALALTADTLVGIDVEYVPPAFNPSQLATRIFSPRDLARFQALPAADQPDAFFQAWTGKEACLKALGVGIAEGLGEVAVPFVPQVVPTPFTHHHARSTGLDWHIQSLPVPACYVGNLTWNDPRKSVDFRAVSTVDEV